MLVPILTKKASNRKRSTFESYKNKKVYSIHIGDTLEIYYSTNSCCKYCSPNAKKLNHLRFIGTKNVVHSKKGCEGCNWTKALVFVAQSTGIDTLKDAIVPPMTKCNDSLKELSNYIIHIR